MKAGIDVNHGNGASFYSDTDSLKSSVLGSTPLPLNSEQSAAFGDYYSLQVKKLEGESMVATPFTPVPVDIINMHGDLNRVVPAGFIMLYNKLDEIQKESSQKGSTFLGAGGLGEGPLAALGTGAGIAAEAGAAAVAIAAVGPGTIAAANVDWDAYTIHMKNRDAAEVARREAEPAVPLTVMGPGNIAAANTNWDAYRIHMLKRDAMFRGQLMTTSEVIEEETIAAEQTYTDYLVKNGATVDEVETAKATAEALQTGASSNPRYNTQPSNYLLAKQAIDTIPRGTWQYNVIMNFISVCESGDMVMAQNLWEGESGAKEALSSYKPSSPSTTPLTVMGPGNIAAATKDWSKYTTYMDNRDAAEVARREAAALNARVEAAPSTTTTLAEASANFKSSLEAAPKSTTSNAKELLQTVMQGSTAEQKKAVVETLEDMGITEQVVETFTDSTTLNALAHIAQQEKNKIPNTGATAAQVADPSAAVPGYDIKQINSNTSAGVDLYIAPSMMTYGDFLPAGAMTGLPVTVLTSGVGIPM